MPTLEFEVEYSYPDDITRGIIVPVEVQAARPIRLHAHVDTGAAFCLFKSEFAEIIGLTLTDGERKHFAPAGGGSIRAFGHAVTLQVLGHSVESVVYFTDDPCFKRNVLGRQGWLHHFKFGLAVYESKLYLGSAGR